MKTILLELAVLTLTLDAFCQGTVVFNNRVTGAVIARVYLCAGSYSGNGAEDYPPGAMNWAGKTLVAGPEYCAVLLAAPGANAPQASLVVASAVTTFRTGTAAGCVVPLTAVLPNVPKDAPVATLQMAAWESKGGVFTNWASAQAAWQAGILRAGKSAPFNLNAIGGDLNTPPNLLGLQSFNIVDMSMYPAPQVGLEPPTRVAIAGETVVLQAHASSMCTVDFRWFHNRADMSAPNSNSLTFTNVSVADSGTYSVLAWSSSCGSIVGSSMSSEVFLRVLSAHPQLVIRAGQGMCSDGFYFTLLSDGGLVCDLQRSTDLVAWEPFACVTNTIGELGLRDPLPSNASPRFYRVLVRP